MSSLRELRAANLLMRADLPKIRLDQIHAEPGFNPAETDADYALRVDGIVNHLREGGNVPPIEVRPRDEGGMWIVDGHARVDAYRRAQAAGVPLQDKDGHVYVLATIFQGSDADRTLRLITSAEGRTLSPLQQSEVMKRLRGYGWSPSEIARRTGRSAEYISQLLALGDADSDIKALVTTGQVSALVAAKAVRKHKGQAKAVLEGQLETVKAKGKSKVTANTAEGGFTDTQRLDFVISEGVRVYKNSDGSFNAEAAVRANQVALWHDSPRKAIDELMKGGAA